MSAEGHWHERCIWNWSWGFWVMSKERFFLWKRGETSQDVRVRGDDGLGVLCCHMTRCPCQHASQLFKDPHACVTIRLFVFFFKIFKLGVNLAPGIESCSTGHKHCNTFQAYTFFEGESRHLSSNAFACMRNVQL